MNDLSDIDNSFWDQQIAAGRAVRAAIAKDDVEALMAATPEALWVADSSSRASQSSLSGRGSQNNPLGIAGLAIRNGSAKCLVAILGHPAWIAGRCSDGKSRRGLMREVYSQIQDARAITCAAAIANSSRSLAWDLLAFSTPKKDDDASAWSSLDCNRNFTVAFEALLPGGLASDCPKDVANVALSEALAGPWLLGTAPDSVALFARAMMDEDLIMPSVAVDLLGVACSRLDAAASLYSLAIDSAPLRGAEACVVPRIFAEPSGQSRQKAKFGPDGRLCLSNSRSCGGVTFTWNAFMPEVVDARWLAASRSTARNIGEKLLLIEGLGALADGFGDSGQESSRPTSSLAFSKAEHPLGAIWDIWSHARKASSRLPETAFAAASAHFDKIALAWSHPQWSEALSAWSSERDEVLALCKTGPLPETFLGYASRPTLGEDPLLKDWPLSPLAWARSERQLSSSDMSAIVAAQGAIGYSLSRSVSELGLLGVPIGPDVLALLEAEVLGASSGPASSSKRRSMRV